MNANGIEYDLVIAASLFAPMKNVEVEDALARVAKVRVAWAGLPPSFR